MSTETQERFVIPIPADEYRCWKVSRCLLCDGPLTPDSYVFTGPEEKRDPRMLGYGFLCQRCGSMSQRERLAFGHTRLAAVQQWVQWYTGQLLHLMDAGMCDKLDRDVLTKAYDETGIDGAHVIDFRDSMGCPF